jgi:hypothetical protein
VLGREAMTAPEKATHVNRVGTVSAVMKDRLVGGVLTSGTPRPSSISAARIEAALALCRCLIERQRLLVFFKCVPPAQAEAALKQRRIASSAVVPARPPRMPSRAQSADDVDPR